VGGLTVRARLLDPSTWPIPLMIVAVALVVGSCGAALQLAVKRYLDAPVVFISWETKECVRVDDPAAKAQRRPAYTCSNLPETFESVWVR